MSVDMGKTIELVREQVAVSLNLSERMVNVDMTSAQGQHIIYFYVNAVSNSFKERGVVSYPADWWQALKARWFPDWMKRRFPVRLVEKSWERWCPHLLTDEPNLHLSFLSQGSPAEEFSLWPITS